MSKEQSPPTIAVTNQQQHHQKGPSFDDILQMLKKSFIEETKDLREELMDWKVKCKELEKQNNILDYRIKGSNNRISELEKKLEETEELKNSTMRKYYDLKREHDDLNMFKTSITHMVSPTKDKTIPKSSSTISSTISSSLSSTTTANLSSKFTRSPEVRKHSGSILSSMVDYNDTNSNYATSSMLDGSLTNNSSTTFERDFDPIMTTSQQRNKYGSDSPIIFHSKTPQKNRDQPIRSRSATNSSMATRKRTSILKDQSSLATTATSSREKNVKFSPGTKDLDIENLNSIHDSFSAPPTPHSSFGVVQHTRKSSLDLKTEELMMDKNSSSRSVSTPSRRPSRVSSNNNNNTVANSTNSIHNEMMEEIGNDVSAQELYLRVKKALSSEEFKTFSTNIRKLNMGEQSITTTLVNLREIIGDERQHLYSHLKRVISSGEM